MDIKNKSYHFRTSKTKRVLRAIEAARARWAGTTQKERSAEMSRVAKFPRKQHVVV